MRAWQSKASCVSLSIPASAKTWLVRVRLTRQDIPHKVDGRALVLPSAYKAAGVDAVDLARWEARKAWGR